MDKENILPVQPLKLSLKNFLKAQMHLELEQNLSHDQIQKATEIEEIKRGNNNYEKKQLNFTQKNMIDDKMKKIQDKIIDDIFQFNEQIKIDDYLFEQIFEIREKKALQEGSEGEIQEQLNNTYKLFDY